MSIADWFSDEEQEEIEEIETYIHKIKCENCGTVNSVEIPRGQTIVDHLVEENEECENCGVRF